jgi:hypothetical protein
MPDLYLAEPTGRSLGTYQEGQFHHIAEAGSSLGQAVAQVLEHLPRLRCGIPGPVERVTSLPELVALRREAAAGHLVRGSSGGLSRLL